MNLSIIIIGRNASKTLDQCIRSINESIDNSSFKENEIIYVDSNSTDESVSIAKNANTRVISITSGQTTAALGRYLGIKYSRFDTLAFIDSDMIIDLNWFDHCL